MPLFQNQPTVALIGRSNVGKSSLFNTIAGYRHALVLPEAGTTRDRLEVLVRWQHKSFILIDTGGLDPVKTDPYHDPIIFQAEQAMMHADVLILVVDIRVGILPEDERIARRVLKLNKPTILAVNKCDTPRHRSKLSAYQRLHVPLFPVSAVNGVGTGDLLDAITELLEQPKTDETAAAADDLTIALVGKPNVGKSSIVNSICGEERMIVAEIPHTTRDSQELLVRIQEQPVRIIDTAGIRRRTAKGGEIEQLSITKSRAALKRADVAILVIDSSADLSSQDKRLVQEINTSGKGLVIVANKWDMIPDKDSHTLEQYRGQIRSALPALSWAPILLVSATAGTRMVDIITTAREVSGRARKHIDEKNLAQFAAAIATRRKPTIGKGTRRPRLLRLTQTASNPPAFLLEIPTKTNIAHSYRQYIINELREQFGFIGVPITLIIKERAVSKKEQEQAGGGRRKRSHRSRNRRV